MPTPDEIREKVIDIVCLVCNLPGRDILNSKVTDLAITDVTQRFIAQDLTQFIRQFRPDSGVRLDEVNGNGTVAQLVDLVAGRIL